MGNSPGQIPVIDLFAGPGGLSEGFARAGMCNWFDGRTTANSAINNVNPGLFRIALSIEKDAVAHKTLELRAFFRQFSPDEVPEDYFSHLRGDISRLELFDAWPAQANAAKSEAWCAELGLEDSTSVDRRIKTALSGADEWVLIGGPPCQAYSLVGRSRNRGIEDYKPEADQRHFLYREYLRIVAAHRPPVFIMENVKGLLSARINGRLIFDQILEDLRQPGQAVAFNVPGNLQYRLYSFVESPDLGLYEVEQPNDFVIKMEKHGIPQARHRIILLGVRNDLEIDAVNLLPIREPVQLQHVLAGCPPLRSGLSKEPDSPDAWREVVQSVVSNDSLFERSHDDLISDVRTRMIHAVHSLRNRQKDRGGEFVRCVPRIEYLPGWYLDNRLGGLCNHSTRGHIASDLHRYLFAACWATEHGSSPSLREYPRSLLPAHENANGNSSETMHFADRFRVQIRDRPSTTITSHISKDGHYYIHPDPSQCRSLTVREAARIQTFPDNYYFCGPRTEQYRQVGNAVPPLLAVQIAEQTMQILQDTGYA